MKVAIPIFGPRVSPRFDFAPALLIFTLQDGKVCGAGRNSVDYLELMAAVRKDERVASAYSNLRRNRWQL